MTGIEHAIMTTIILFAFYKWGEWKGREQEIEEVIESTLDSLENQGFIITELNADGEKELMKVQKKVLTYK